VTDALDDALALGGILTVSRLTAILGGLRIPPEGRRRLEAALRAGEAIDVRRPLGEVIRFTPHDSGLVTVQRGHQRGPGSGL